MLREWSDVLVLFFFLQLDLLLLIRQLAPGVKLRCKDVQRWNNIDCTILGVFHKRSSLVKDLNLEGVIRSDQIGTCLSDKLKNLRGLLCWILEVIVDGLLKDEERHIEILT